MHEFEMESLYGNLTRPSYSMNGEMNGMHKLYVGDLNLGLLISIEPSGLCFWKTHRVASVLPG